MMHEARFEPKVLKRAGGSRLLQAGDFAHKTEGPAKRNPRELSPRLFGSAAVEPAGRVG